MVIGGAVAMVVFGPRARAAEFPTDRTWIVWDTDADKPWTSAKGYRATATGPTACSMSLHEAAKASPTGSRLACRKVRR
jgi:hypothetical protein